MNRKTLYPAAAADCNACVRPGANIQQLLRPLRGRQSLLRHLPSGCAARPRANGFPCLRHENLCSL